MTPQPKIPLNPTVLSLAQQLALRPSSPSPAGTSHRGPRLVLGISLGLVAALVGLGGVNAANQWARPYYPAGGFGLIRSGYMKSPHTFQEVKVEGGAYHLTYRFRDHKGRDWQWEWAYPQGETDQAIHRFGVPQWMFQPYQPTPEETQRREQAMVNGLFIQEGQLIHPDYNRMIEAYRDYTLPLHQMAMEAMGGASPEERLEFLLKFTQDIPYAEPPNELPDRVLSGLLPPPQVLVEQFGDCDSKAVLLSAILAHDSSYDIVFLYAPGHLLMGVAGVPQPYQAFAEFQGKRYILTEPAGTARLAFGEPMKAYANFQNITPLRYSPYNPASSSQVAGLPHKAVRHQPASGVYLTDEKASPGQVLLKMGAGSPHQVLAVLSQEGREIPGAAFAHQNRGEIFVETNYGQAGNYLLKIFAKPAGDPGQYSLVLEYPFTGGSPGRPAEAYPKPFEYFNQIGGYLDEPKSGMVRAGQTLNVRVNLPGTDQAFIHTGGKLVPLARNGSQFSGQVLPAVGDMVLFGAPPGETKLRGLLQFQAQ
ncbi:MAG: hypothetical protein OEV94_07795 [Deltaproteobacteria bacterium]|nr:hypothetical protein [Deltaproteobacteria bacterium]